MLRRGAPRLTSLALALASLPGCFADDGLPLPPVYQPSCVEVPFPGAPLGSRCGRLVDAEGRVVTLRGVNARIDGVFDVLWDPTQPPLMPLATFDAGDAEQIRQFGFDALRLPINWSGVEPTKDGGFDESYLDRVAAVVSLAADAGIRVLIDLHQDAYSKEMGGDGAPLWAIEPPPVTLGPDPTAATAPQVVEAFDTFFGASPAGANLRARFIAMATHVAARFAAEPAVIGLEIYNEPPPGIDALRPFYDAALASFRQVSPDKLFVFEPTGLRNIFDTTSNGPGSLGPGTAYAPHVYTFVFNHQAGAADMTKDDLRPSNVGAADEAASWDAPALVTEWGYGPDAVHAADFFTWQAELQEENQLSSFLWLWKELSPSFWGCFDYDAATGAFTERPAMKKWLARVRPSAVAGWPTAYSFDRASGVFDLAFRSDPSVDAAHLIAVAPLLGAPLAVTCDGAAVEASPFDAWGTLSIRCGGTDGADHTLRVTVAPLP
jgi:endoglycosylceramidase